VAFGPEPAKYLTTVLVNPGNLYRFVGL
jgi:hypothetical protein